jgi:hypothetical protein
MKTIISLAFLSSSLFLSLSAIAASTPIPTADLPTYGQAVLLGGFYNLECDNTSYRVEISSALTSATSGFLDTSAKSSQLIFEQVINDAATTGTKYQVFVTTTADMKSVTALEFLQLQKTQVNFGTLAKPNLGYDYVSVGTVQCTLVH